jgi:hypothetical protein
MLPTWEYACLIEIATRAIFRRDLSRRPAAVRFSQARQQSTNRAGFKGLKANRTSPFRINNGHTTTSVESAAMGQQTDIETGYAPPAVGTAPGTRPVTQDAHLGPAGQVGSRGHFYDSEKNALAAKGVLPGLLAGIYQVPQLADQHPAPADAPPWLRA